MARDSMSWYRDQLVNNSHKFDFPIHKPYFELSDEQKTWFGMEITILKDLISFLNSGK